MSAIDYTDNNDILGRHCSVCSNGAHYRIDCSYCSRSLGYTCWVAPENNLHADEPWIKEDDTNLYFCNTECQASFLLSGASDAN